MVVDGSDLSQLEVLSSPFMYCRVRCADAISKNLHAMARRVPMPPAFRSNNSSAARGFPP